MAPEPATADHVYRRVRHEILEGTLLPGQVLKLGHLTDAFGTSATPVRDALNRLVGERFVDLLPGGGFRVRPLGAARLATLYQWHGQLVQLGLGTGISQPAKARIGALRRDLGRRDQLASATSALFAILASDAGNTELEDALTAASQALARAWALEHHLLPGLRDELSQLMVTIEGDAVTAARRAMARYHRERIRLSPTLHKMIPSGHV